MCCSQKNVLIFFDRYLYFTSSSWSFSAVHLRAVANRISDTINSLPTELNLSISPESSSSFIFCIIIIIFHGNSPQKEGSQKKLDFMGNPRVKALSSFMKFGTDSHTLGSGSVSSDWESFQCSGTLTMYLKNCRSERCRACGKSSRAEGGSRDFEPINTSGSHSNIYIWIVPFCDCVVVSSLYCGGCLLYCCRWKKYRFTIVTSKEHKSEYFVKLVYDNVTSNSQNNCGEIWLPFKFVFLELSFQFWNKGNCCWGKLLLRQLIAIRHEDQHQ